MATQDGNSGYYAVLFDGGWPVTGHFSCNEGEQLTDFFPVYFYREDGGPVRLGEQQWRANCSLKIGMS